MNFEDVASKNNNEEEALDFNDMFDLNPKEFEDIYSSTYNREEVPSLEELQELKEGVYSLKKMRVKFTFSFVGELFKRTESKFRINREELDKHIFFHILSGSSWKGVDKNSLESEELKRFDEIDKYIFCCTEAFYEKYKDQK